MGEHSPGQGRHSVEDLQSKLNQAPQPGKPELTEEIIGALDPSNLQGFRDAQDRRREEFLNSPPDGIVYQQGLEAQLPAEYDKVRQDFLDNYGIDPSNPDFDRINSLLSDISIDKMSDTEWKNDTQDAQGNHVHSGRNQAADLQYELQNKFNLVNGNTVPLSISQRLNPGSVHNPDPEATQVVTNPDQTVQLPPRRGDPDQTQPVNPNVIPPALDVTQRLPLVNTLNQPPDPNQTQPVANPNIQQPNINQQQQNPNVILQGDPNKITPEMWKTFNNLNLARSELAELSSKRQNRLFGRGNRAFEDAQRRYNELMVQYITDLKDWQGVNNVSYDKQNEFVVAHILDQTRTLRAETTEKFENGVVMKIARWMAKGNLAQRIAKGALISAGGVLVGAAATVLTGGGALIGGVGAGAAAGLVVRGTRGFAASRGRARNGPLTHEQESAIVGAAHSYGGNYAGTLALNMANMQVERSVKGEHSSNRRAALIGGFAMIAGSLAGEVAGSALHSLVNQTAHIGGTAEMPGTAHAMTGHGGHGGGMETPHNSVDSMYINHLTPNQLAAFNIGNGEGGIELMHNLGHGATDWFNMQDQLFQQHPGDFYRMPDGNIGLRHPGRLSAAAIQDISQRLNIWQ